MLQRCDSLLAKRKMVRPALPKDGGERMIGTVDTNRFFKGYKRTGDSKIFPENLTGKWLRKKWKSGEQRTFLPNLCEDVSEKWSWALTPKFLEPSQTLFKWAQDEHSEEAWACVFLQVLWGIEFMVDNRRCHGDLHIGNIQVWGVQETNWEIWKEEVFRGRWQVLVFDYNLSGSWDPDSPIRNPDWNDDRAHNETLGFPLWTPEVFWWNDLIRFTLQWPGIFTDERCPQAIKILLFLVERVLGYGILDVWCQKDSKRFTGCVNLVDFEKIKKEKKNTQAIVKKVIGDWRTSMKTKFPRMFEKNLSGETVRLAF